MPFPAKTTLIIFLLFVCTAVGCRTDIWDDHFAMHTVHFDSRGGTPVESVTLEHGKLIPKPADPEREFYSFSGWYQDEAFNEAWDFDNDELRSSFTLYADWAGAAVAEADDNIEIEQGGTKTIAWDILTDNDKAYIDGESAGSDKIQIIGIADNSELNLDVTVDTDNKTLTMTSKGIYHEEHSFEYIAQNTISGATDTAKVTLTVNQLPQTEVNVEVDITGSGPDNYDPNNLDLEPPTFNDIFAEWPVFDGNDLYASVDDALPGSNAGEWYLTNEQVFQPENAQPATGFVTPASDALERFTLQATVSSSWNDDDEIGLVLAFTNDGFDNRYLFAARTVNLPQKAGGHYSSGGWIIGYYDSNLYGTVATNKNNNQAYGSRLLVDGAVSTTDTSSSTTGWASELTGTRIRAERSGNTITLKTTDLGTTSPYQDDSEIVIDLGANTVSYQEINAGGSHTGTWITTNVTDIDSNIDLSIFCGPQQYGYYSFSQPASTYCDIELAGSADDEIIVQLDPDTRTGDGTPGTWWSGSIVWRYINDEWVITGETIQDVYGYPRIITNSDSADEFEISADRVTLL